ncbi:hypothetical protein CNR22_04615 [Sphingobacteriaceae bacterium]|nr:hypothetical protein CNR22_04615 [Sphingobacteriaceae bacterium]
MLIMMRVGKKSVSSANTSDTSYRVRETLHKITFFIRQGFPVLVLDPPKTSSVQGVKACCVK